METIEMDLMQAQIGSLATDVSRLEAKVAKGGGGSGLMVELTNITPVTATKFYATASILAAAIKDAILAGIPVKTILDTTPLGGNMMYSVPIDTLYYADGVLKMAKGILLISDSDGVQGRYTIDITPTAEGEPLHTAVISYESYA